MKAWFSLTLVDLSEEMLAVSRRLNPECRHRQGDMRSLRLGRTFDAVFVPDDTRESFAPESDHGGIDGTDGRGVRYLSWTFDPAGRRAEALRGQALLQGDELVGQTAR